MCERYSLWSDNHPYAQFGHGQKCIAWSDVVSLVELHTHLTQTDLCFWCYAYAIIETTTTQISTKDAASKGGRVGRCRGG